MKYFIIAGNHSDDIQAARLSQAIMRNDVRAEVVGIGGSRMVKAGINVLGRYSEFTNDPLFFSPYLSWKSKKKVGKYLEDSSADILIVLNPNYFFLFKSAKKLGVRTCYYNSPYDFEFNYQKKKLNKSYIDKTLFALPPAAKTDSNIDGSTEYVGCPLIDSVKDYKYDPQFQVDPAQITITVLPGDGFIEIERSIKLVQELIEKAPEFRFLIAGSSTVRPEVYKNLEKIVNAEIFFDNEYDLVKRANACIVFSNVASLETALLNCPQVYVCKRHSIVSSLSKIFEREKWKSLVNIVSGKQIVKEVDLSNDKNDTVLIELNKMVTDHHYCARIMEDYQELLEKIGAESASKNAARIINEWINPD